MRTLLLALMTILMVPFGVSAQDIYLTADAMIDVIDGKRVGKPAIVIREDRIVAIGRQGQLEVPEDARVINLDGQTLLPGFMDMHVHLSGGPETPFF